MDAAPPLVTGPIPIYFRPFKYFSLLKKEKRKINCIGKKPVIGCKYL